MAQADLELATWGGRAERGYQEIASKLVRFVPNSGVVAIDSSPAGRALAERLTSSAGLDVITNGLGTFSALCGRPGVRAMLTGGRVDARDCLVGPLARQSARRLVTSRFFLSPSAADPALGAREIDFEVAQVKVAFGELTTEVVLACGSWSLGSLCGAPVLPWSSIGVLVTDLDSRDPRLDPYRDRVEIV